MMCWKESPYKNVSANKREDEDDFPSADGVAGAPDAPQLNSRRLFPATYEGISEDFAANAIKLPSTAGILKAIPRVGSHSGKS